MNTKSIFLKSNATIESLKDAMPKATTTCGFVVVDNHIEYVGKPSTFKYIIPKMVAVVNQLEDFEVVKTPKLYTDKNGNIATTNVVTFSFKNEKDAQILCDNMNRYLKAEYEQYKASKETE